MQNSSLGTGETALILIPQNLTNEKSALVQVMAWCRQATSHYLSQCSSIFLASSGCNKLRWISPTYNHPSLSLCTVINPLLLIYLSSVMQSEVNVSLSCLKQLLIFRFVIWFPDFPQGGNPSSAQWTRGRRRPAGDTTPGRQWRIRNAGGKGRLLL